MICVDASIVFKWLVPADEERVELANALLEEQLEYDQDVIAPPLVWSEIANTLHRRVITERATLEWADNTLADFLELPVITPQYSGLYRDALQIASRYRLPAIYDAQYVALAQYTGCDFWTDGHKLIRAVQPELPLVRALSEFKPHH